MQIPIAMSLAKGSIGAPSILIFNKFIVNGVKVLPVKICNENSQIKNTIYTKLSTLAMPITTLRRKNLIKKIEMINKTIEI